MLLLVVTEGSSSVAGLLGISPVSSGGTSGGCVGDGDHQGGVQFHHGQWQYAQAPEVVV